MSALESVSTWEAERRGYIRCRTLGHSWFDYDSNWKSSIGTPLTLRCERCGMERRDTIGSNGNLVGRHYHRPAGYQLRRGEYKPSRNNFRQMLLALRQSEKRTSKRSTA